MLRWDSQGMRSELGYYVHLHVEWRCHIKLGHRQETLLPCFSFQHGMDGPRDSVGERC